MRRRSILYYYWEEFCFEMKIVHRRLTGRWNNFCIRPITRGTHAIEMSRKKRKLRSLNSDTAVGTRRGHLLFGFTAPVHSRLSVFNFNVFQWHLENSLYYNYFFFYYRYRFYYCIGTCFNKCVRKINIYLFLCSLFLNILF